jgi:hypothetical protein
MLRDELDQREEEIADTEDTRTEKEIEIRQLKAAANIRVGPCPFSTVNKCTEDISQLSRKALVDHFQKHVKGNGVATLSQTSSSSFNCPLLLPNGGLCKQSIAITPCGTAVKAHYQHNCQPGTVQPNTIQQFTIQPGSWPTGRSAAEIELIKKLPYMVDFNATMQVEADRARITNDKDCPESVENPNALDPVATGGNKESPLSTPAGETNPDTTNSGGGDTDTGPTATGFARKRKTTASPRKVSAKTPAGSKRKKAVMDEEEEEGSGEHPGFLFPKTPRSGKRQRVIREETFGMAGSAGGDDSGDGDMMDRETSARLVGVRRTTRATSGTPGPIVGLVAPVAKKGGRPRGRQADEDDLEEEEEEEMEIIRSPAKRGRQSPAKKGAK